MKLLKTSLILLLVTVVFSCSQNAENSQSTKDDITKITEHIKVERNGLQLNYETCGQGEFTLLLVHGWCINQTYWESQVKAFCPNYKVVTMDLAGHGKSGKNRTHWTIDNYAKDVNAVIAQLQLENVVLVGHSMGGNIVLEAALQNPDIVAVIGIDNFKEVGVEYTEEMRAEVLGFFGAMKSNFKGVVSSYASGALFHPSTTAEVKNRVMNDFVSADSIIAVATLESLFEHGLQEAEKLSALKRPFYVIGSNAIPTNVEGVKATGVPFKLVEIDATGHYPMMEKPEEFNELLKGVVEEIEIQLKISVLEKLWKEKEEVVTKIGEKQVLIRCK